ncbi:MAG TPA: PEGA domain-containing protein [Candidatus Paceibacterota bacterium]
MTKKTKRYLFFVAVFLFFVIGCSAVFFALGYQYDFVQRKILKTGSIEIKSNVDFEVYINEKLAGSTSFLSNSFSRGRLLPRTYKVRVEKEGYQSWEKLIKVEAGFLSSFPKVFLVPEVFNEELVASSSMTKVSLREFDPENGVAVIGSTVGNKQKLDYINLKTGQKESVTSIVSADKNKQVAVPTGSTMPRLVTSPDKSKNAIFYDYEIWAEWSKDSNFQPYHVVGDKKFVMRSSQKISDIQWYKDSEHLLVSVGGILKMVEIDSRDGVNIFEITDLDGPFYYDKELGFIFKFEGNNLFKLAI